MYEVSLCYLVVTCGQGTIVVGRTLEWGWGWGRSPLTVRDLMLVRGSAEVPRFWRCSLDMLSWWLFLDPGRFIRCAALCLFRYCSRGLR